MRFLLFSLTLIMLPTVNSVDADYVWKDGECFDDFDPRLLERHLNSQEDMTPELCIEKCKDNATSFAGVQYHNECWCGDTQPPKEKKRPKSECNLACTGDSSIMCGGQYRMNIYLLDSVWKDGECYDDDPRLLERYLISQEDMTPELCIGKCKDNAYSYAGVQYYNECWCGDTQPPKEEKSAKSECNLACTGDSSIMCGGQYRMNIYFLDSVWKDGECYDDYDPRLLERHLTSQEDMTPELCIEKCKDNAYSYAGVQYHNECWCGDTKPPKEEKRPKSECKLACTGDSSIMCGGQYRMNIYFVDGSLGFISGVNSNISALIALASTSSDTIEVTCCCYENSNVYTKTCGKGVSCKDICGPNTSDCMAFATSDEDAADRCEEGEDWCNANSGLQGKKKKRAAGWTFLPIWKINFCVRRVTKAAHINVYPVCCLHPYVQRKVAGVKAKCCTDHKLCH